MPLMARLSASRTNAVVRPGATPAMRGASWRPTVCLTPMREAYVAAVTPTGHLRWSRAHRAPAQPVGLSGSGALRPRGRPRRRGRGPGAGHAAGGVPPRAVPDAVGAARRPDAVVLAGTPRGAAAGRAGRVAVAEALC